MHAIGGILVGEVADRDPIGADAQDGWLSLALVTSAPSLPHVQHVLEIVHAC